MSKRLNTRACAAKLSWEIIDKGQSLDKTISDFFQKHQHPPQDRGFTQELVYGVCRWYGELDEIASRLLKSPIRKKDRVVHFVLLVGLYQLLHIKTAAHAGVGETVAACKQLNKHWAKNLINGCLRNYLRAPIKLNSDADQLSHPTWIRQAIEAAWPVHAAAIFSANNRRPPMCLRVNRRQYKPREYQTLLKQAQINAALDPYASDGLILETPCPVTALPQFVKGACSVQDTAAQIGADLLKLEPQLNVLDACAAPGGKTAHMLERCGNQLTLHALDISQQRCEQLNSTLNRLGLNAKVTNADASKTPSWDLPDGGYDRILIDAPCSGLGVIRRHPDIKHHRRPSDIDTLQKTQALLLDKLWPLLKPRGILLYMTCSILPAENEWQIEQFLARTNDAMLGEISHPNALVLNHGVQTLPGVHDMDGFYYCQLLKR